MGLRAKAAARAIHEFPDRANSFELLLKSGRHADALTVLQRIVDAHPSDIRAAFASMDIEARMLAADPARNHADVLRAIIARARQRIGGLPREQAAEAARELIRAEGELSLGRGDGRQRLATFVAEYAGTPAALLAEVDLISAI